MSREEVQILNKRLLDLSYLMLDRIEQIIEPTLFQVGSVATPMERTIPFELDFIFDMKNYEKL